MFHLRLQASRGTSTSGTTTVSMPPAGIVKQGNVDCVHCVHDHVWFCTAHPQKPLHMLPKHSTSHYLRHTLSVRTHPSTLLVVLCSCGATNFPPQGPLLCSPVVPVVLSFRHDTPQAMLTTRAHAAMLHQFEVCCRSNIAMPCVLGVYGALGW